MADCTHVILVFDNGKARVYDPKEIDSIFFDDEKARCFRDNCLDGSGGSDPDRTLDAQIGKPGRGGAGGASGGSGGAGKGGATEPGQEASLTSTAVAMETTTIVAAVSAPCIHKRDCTWDCPTE